MHRVEIAFGRGLRMELKTRDIVFVVSDAEGKLGELHVSKGSVDWLPGVLKCATAFPGIDSAK